MRQIVGARRLAAGPTIGRRDAVYAPTRRSTTAFLPAPTLGINSTDPPDMIKQGYAEMCDNWWPEESGLTTRGGSIPWSMGPENEFGHSLMVWNGEALFVVAGSGIYQCSAQQSSSYDAVLVHDGLRGGALLQSVNFSNAGLSFLHCCNGADAPFYYDGADWITSAFTLNNETFDASGFFHVTSHLQRLWWIENDSNIVYFGDVNAVQGPLHKLPLGGFMRRGGSLACIETITQDGLQGSDDFFVAITTEGEVFLYKGDNPLEEGGFVLIGRGEIPRPIGYPRCTVKYGPDLIVMTEAGLVSLNASLSSVFPGLRTSVMEKISSLWEQNLKLYGGGEGWDITAYHKRGLIIVNMPSELGCRQFVLNPDTNAWVTLSGWENTRTIKEFRGELVAGSLSCVMHLDTLYRDYRDGQMVPIVARVKHSFYGLGHTGIKKRWTLARPYVVSSSTPDAWFGIGRDFLEDPELSRMSYAQESIGGDEWNISDWGLAEWSIGDTTRRGRTRWMQALGCGYWCAPIFEVETNSQTITYAGVELQYEPSNTI